MEVADEVRHHLELVRKLVARVDFVIQKYYQPDPKGKVRPRQLHQAIAGSIGLPIVNSQLPALINARLEANGFSRSSDKKRVWRIALKPKGS